MRRTRLRLALALTLLLSVFALPAQGSDSVPRTIYVGGQMDFCNQTEDCSWSGTNRGLRSEHAPDYLAGQPFTAGLRSWTCDSHGTGAPAPCYLELYGELEPVSGHGPSCENFAGTLDGSLDSADGLDGQLSLSWTHSLSAAAPVPLGPAVVTLPVSGSYGTGVDTRLVAGQLELLLVPPFSNTEQNNCHRGLRYIGLNAVLTLL